MKKEIKYLTPKEVKSMDGSKRKEVVLTSAIIDKLSRKAKADGLDLKKFMERSLIKIALMPAKSFTSKIIDL